MKLPKPNRTSPRIIPKNHSHGLPLPINPKESPKRQIIIHPYGESQGSILSYTKTAQNAKPTTTEAIKMFLLGISSLSLMALNVRVKLAPKHDRGWEPELCIFCIAVLNDSVMCF